MNKVEKSQAQGNFESFKTMKFNEILNGQFALLHDEKLVEVYQSRGDAIKTGLLLYKELGAFSVQKIGEGPATFGFQGLSLA